MEKNDILQTSKVFILLCQLNKKEFKDFGLWLRSPIHNKSEKVIKLYEFIKKHKDNYYEINERILLRDAGIISSASKRQAISLKDIKTLRQVMHLLRIQVDDFLAWRSLHQDDTEKKCRIMDVLLEKTMYALIPQVLNKVKIGLESSTIRDIKYCENVFRITEMEFYLEILQNNHNTKKAQDTIDTLRQSFISKLLKYYCSLLSVEKINKNKYQYPLLKHIKQHLESNHTDRSIPVIYVYYALLRLIEEEKQEDYHDVKKYLFKYSHHFSTTYIRQFFNILTNYCYRKIKNGEDEFIQERFGIFKKGIELKCWSSGTYFSGHQFIHIVKTALFLSKLDWLDKFFQEHNNLLNPNVKDVFVNYYHALVAFKLKQYDAAQHHLHTISADKDFIYYMQTKVLLIKIHYDKNELIFSNAEEHPINYDLEAISNFANFFKRILNRKKKIIYKEPLSKANLKALQNDLAKLKPLIERTWLEKKIEELMQEIK